MALHFEDDELDHLAEKARRILNAPTKAEAVKQALERLVADNEKDKPPLEERLKALQDRLQRIGTPNPNFDDKAFFDEMWGM